MERPGLALDFVAALACDKLTARHHPIQTLHILETERLNLRELNVEDAAFVLQLVNEPEWLRFIGDRGVHTLDAATGYILNSFLGMYARLGFGMWLVERKEDGAAIGICGLIKRDALEDIDLGFAFLAGYRRKGYAFEATTATTAYAKNTLSLGRILAIVSPDNDASRSLLAKLGFRFEQMTRLPTGTAEVMLYAINL